MKTLCAISFLPLFFVSCDILRQSPFEVSGWSPGGAYHEEPGQIVISLDFSHDPDRASVERYFSLQEEGSRLKGSFYWENKTMRFSPAAPLEKNRDYVMQLSAEAHNKKGLSLDDAFEGRFSTRPERARPVLLSVFPEKDAVVSDIRCEVRLVFSKAMSLNSLRDNVSFSPPVSGLWRITDDGKTASFVPAEPWTAGKSHEIRISASLNDALGLSLGNESISVFTVGTDRIKPELIGAWRIMGNGDETPLSEEIPGVFAENSGWEKNDRLKLVFSEAVDVFSVKNCLSAEGAPGLVPETPPGFSAGVIFKFESRPVFGSRFVFRLKTGVKDMAGNASGAEYGYGIFANGSHSKPPELAGMRMPKAPGNPDNFDLIDFFSGALFEDLPIEQEKYPAAKDTQTWIELYFDLVPGEKIDPLSVMELFRVETSNSVLTFSPREIRDSGFFVSAPRPGWEQYQRLEIRGILINSVHSGLVNFIVAPGLRDSAGNRSEKTFRISLVK
jgi:hypothetical protein